MACNRLNILCILNGTILGSTQNWYFWILLMVRTPWGAYSPKKFFWRWVRLLSRYRLPKWAKMSVRAIFTNKRNFFPRDDLKHSKNQSGPKWPHLSIFSLKFCVIWRSGPPGCRYVSSKFVGPNVVAQKCAFIVKSTIFTFWWSIFFLNSSEKHGQTDSGA